MSGRVPLAAGILALAGCGGDADDDAPVATLEQYLTAVEQGDKAEACGLLSEGYLEFVERAESSPCEESLDVTPNPEVVEDIRAGRFEVTRDRHRAIVRPANGLGGYELTKEGDKWRVVNPG